MTITTELFTPKVITTAIFVAMLGIAGCSQSDTKTEAETTDTSVVATGDTAQAVEVSTDADPTEKLNAYIDCANNTIASGNRSYARYKLWVTDMEGGPTGNETHNYGTYSIDDSFIAQCTDIAVAATSLTPSLPELDKAVIDYATALENYAQVVNEANAYYEQSNYKDDDYAKAQELHPQLVSTFAIFEPAAEKFQMHLDELNRKVQADRLMKVEQAEGKKFTYWNLATSIAADNLSTHILQEDFDVGEANTLLAAYESNMNDWMAYIKTDAEDLPTTTFSIESATNNLLIAAKERIRRVRDNKEYTQSEISQINSGAGWMVEGSPDAFVKAYNSYVDASNRI